MSKEANYREFLELPAWTTPVWKDGKVINEADPYKWSGSKPPPAIGEHVHCYMNGLGEGKAVGYFVEYGWLGVLVQLRRNPKWRRDQLKEYRKNPNPPATMFGIDLEPRKPLKVTT